MCKHEPMDGHDRRKGSGERGVNGRWEGEYIEGSTAMVSPYYPKGCRGPACDRRTPAIGTDFALQDSLHRWRESLD